MQLAEDIESFDPAGMQGPTPVQVPGDEWTQWTNCPSYGGKRGRRMSDVARYNAETGIMQVRFATGGRGTPNTYAYSSIDEETWDNFMSGRWSENGTATHWFLTPWGGVRV
jgi:KTSC domain